MKVRLAVVALMLITGRVAQTETVQFKGMIYGIAIDRNGQPAKGVGLTAFPAGAVAVGGVLPHVKTNQAGEYRFKNLDFGEWGLYAQDDEAGYSSFSTGGYGSAGSFSEVELTAEHPQANLLVTLPPKAGFVHVHLTNRETGAVVSTMRVELMLAETPDVLAFRMEGESSKVILVPPEKHLLLHVTADGFHEWRESAGTGKLIYLPSGAQLKLDVQLERIKD